MNNFNPANLELRLDNTGAELSSGAAAAQDAPQTYLDQIRHAVQTFEKFQTDRNTDVFVYFGPIERHGYDLLCEAFHGAKTPRAQATLILSTFGGDPHTAFRIARALSHRYPQGGIEVLVPGWCKSAGTLICIGANELVLADSSELGPLDVQVLKPDEMIGRMSGLDILRGMESLKDGILMSFKQFLVDINAGTGMTTKSAADVATKLAIGIYEPILQQVDPMRLGEMEAALQIAYDYGSRLDERYRNLQANALQRLVHAYPSHNFVIDRKEAKSLFKRVRTPDQIESIIASYCTRMSPLGLNPTGGLMVQSLDKLIESLKQKLPHENSESQGDADETTEPQSSPEAPVTNNSSETESESEPSQSRPRTSNDNDSTSISNDSPANEDGETPATNTRQRRNRQASV